MCLLNREVRGSNGVSHVGSLLGEGDACHGLSSGTPMLCGLHRRIALLGARGQSHRRLPYQLRPVASRQIGYHKQWFANIRRPVIQTWGQLGLRSGDGPFMIQHKARAFSPQFLQRQ